MITILIVLAVLMLLGSLPVYPYSRGWGYGPSGLLGTILIIDHPRHRPDRVACEGTVAWVSIRPMSRRGSRSMGRRLCPAWRRRPSKSRSWRACSGHCSRRRASHRQHPLRSIRRGWSIPRPMRTIVRMPIPIRWRKPIAWHGRWNRRTARRAKNRDCRNSSSRIIGIFRGISCRNRTRSLGGRSLIAKSSSVTSRDEAPSAR
jgi:hypothetical protein